jgi:hypothetical protein
VPLSDTIWLGLPRRATIAVNSRATRRPEIDVSGMTPRHSLLTSSTMLRTRKADRSVVDDIQRRAAENDECIVTIGQLVFFSIETRDAWLLDTLDHLAAWLARAGDSESVQIEDTDTTFAIGWKGQYRIEGPTFVYVDGQSGRVRFHNFLTGEIF